MGPDTIKAIDHAAMQAAANPAWVPIACMVVMGLFIWRISKYFVVSHQTLIDDHRKATEQYQVNLINVLREHSSVSAKAIEAISASTAAIMANTVTMKEVSDSIRYCRTMPTRP